MDIRIIKDLMENINSENEGLGNIINPIIDKYNLPPKEILEVCQIGKFVYKFYTAIRIVEKPNPPRPDFVIEYESELIGLEHTRIFSKKSKNYNSINSILGYTEIVYNDMFPGDKVLAFITFVDDKLEYKQNQKKEIATEIANYVKCLKNNIETKKPCYIEKVKTTKHSKISFSYREINSQSDYLSKDRLAQEIQKKEQKLKIYKRDEKEISKYWLVLFIGSLSSASYKINEEVDYKMTSEFDRVYLMTDFHAEIFRIK